MVIILKYFCLYCLWQIYGKYFLIGINARSINYIIISNHNLVPGSNSPSCRQEAVHGLPADAACRGAPAGHQPAPHPAPRTRPQVPDLRGPGHGRGLHLGLLHPRPGRRELRHQPGRGSAVHPAQARLRHGHGLPLEWRATFIFLLSTFSTGKAKRFSSVLMYTMEN